jgi:hypothetical protein
MAITVFKTFINGEVLLASDLNSSITTLLNEINVHGGEIDTLNGPTQGRSRNLIINGDFSIWQRGTSATTFGYKADDRWFTAGNGNTVTFSRQAFTLGQTDVPGNPQYFSRTVITSSAGASNFTSKYQAVESVINTSGKEVTLSFWAKADSAKNIATEFFQSFGTGGSPSAPVLGINAVTHALTTSWQKFTVTAAIPSVSGKTLGTSGSDQLGVDFWFDAGSDFDSRTNSLGQQSGTFDIANVQLEFGDTATEFEYVSPADQLARCQRYYWRVEKTSSNVALGTTATYTTNVSSYTTLKYPVTMRAIPSISSSAASTFTVYINNAAVAPSAVASEVATEHAVDFRFTIVSTQAHAGIARITTTGGFISADAEL